MADTANIGYASVQVIPVVKGIGKDTANQLGVPFQQAGQKAGRMAGEAIANGVEASAARVKAASDKVAKTQEAATSATNKLAIEEAKLNELRDKGVTGGSRYMAQTERVRAAQVKASQAANGVTQATTELTAAEEAAATATDGLGDSLEETGKKSVFTKDNLVKFGLAAGTALAGAGAALYKIGGVFDDVSDTIRVGTGASGKALADMEQIAKNIGTTVPSSFEDIGASVADVNTRLGLTGDPLQKVTAQFLELGNMGIDADINEVSAALSGFGIKGAEIEGSMDKLFQVSQATGLSVTELSTSVVKAGPALRNFGFGLGESAALVGQLDKSGMDADKTLASMSRAMQAFAKEGKDGKQALFGTVTEIERFIAKGDTAGALNLAGKIFGTKGAGQFVDAVKLGTLSVDDFVSATGATEDTIIGVADETKDFAEQWEMFKNKTLVALEPIASRVFGVIGTAMEYINTDGVPALMSLADWMERNKVVLGIVAGVITAALMPALITSTAAWIKQGWESAKAAATSLASSYKTVGGWIMMGATATAQALKSSAAWVASGARSAGAWLALKAQAVGSFVATAAGAAANGVATSAAWVASGARSAGAWAAMKLAAVGSFVATGASAVLQAGITAGAWVAGQARMAISIGAATAAFLAQKIATAAGAVVTGTLTAAQWALNAAMSANPIGLIIAIIVALVAAIIIAYKNSETFRNIVQACWEGIQTAASFAWDNILKPALDGLLAALGWVGDKAMWLWQNVMIPAWDAIKGAIEAVWNFIKPILDNIGKGIESLGSIASKVGDAMRSAFDGVVDVLKAPIHAVGRLLASLPGSVMGIDIPGVSTIKSWGETLQSLRSGGVIAGISKDGELYGPGTGTSDSIYGVDSSGVPIVRVSRGEGVVNNAAMANGGAAVVAALNANNGVTGKISGGLQALASGGVIGEPYGLPNGTNTGGYGTGGDIFPEWVQKMSTEHNVKPSTYPGHQESDRGEAGYAPNPEHLNRGIDWVGSQDDMQKFAEYLLGIAPDTPGLEQIIWQNPATGQKIGWHGRTKDDGSYFASDYGGHQDHVHLRASTAIGGPAQPVTPDTVTQVPGYESPTLNDGAPDTGTTTGTTKDTARLKTFKELGSDMGGILAGGVEEFFGDSVPSWVWDPNTLMEGDDGSNVRTSGGNSTPADPSAPGTAGGFAPDTPDTVKDGQDPTGLKGAALYAYQIAKAAKDMGLGVKGATIGEATALVEAGDPLQMWANSKVPESLKLPHDAVGSDGTSVGLFQQQQNGAWGTLAQNMDPYKSAELFYGALQKVEGWETMDPGAAAQAVQRSAFPDKYATKMGRAGELVKESKLFDTGGIWEPGTLGYNGLSEPELVIKRHQWGVMDRNAAVVEKLARAGGTGGGSKLADTVNIQGYTAEEIAEEWRRYQWSRTGGYGTSRNR